MKNLILLLSSLLLVIGCEQATAPSTVASQKSNAGNIAFSFDKVNAPAAVKTLTATLSRDGFSTLTQTFNILTDTSATMIFTEVAVGTWKVKVDAKDESDKLLYTGEAEVIVLDGTVSQVNLTLTPVATDVGTVQINVTWGSLPGKIFPRTYGGANQEMGMCVSTTNDGGYILGGITHSYGSGGDAWLVKVNSKGDLLWSQNYGGASEDRINDIVKTDDSGFLLVGYTTGSDEDSWIVKVDSLGTKQWEKKYGGLGDDAFLKIKKAFDGTYLLCGYYSNENFFEGSVAKITAAGDLLWLKTYGGSGADFAMDILPLSEGNAIVVGHNGSIPGQVYDFWAFKISGNGDTLWQKTYGGTSDDRVGGLVMTSNGNFILTGYTNSFGNGTQDAWVVSIDGDGNKLWSKTFGENGSDYLLNIVKASDGNYLAAGFLTLNGSDKQGWVLKIDNAGNFLWSKTYGGIGSETIVDHELTNDDGFIFGGTSSSTNNGLEDFWLGKVNANGNLE